MWELPISALLGAIFAVKLIFCFLAWLAWRTYRRGNAAMPSRMPGLTGKALTNIAREGRVMVQGEYWWARACTSIAAGENIRVIRVDGMILEVEPAPDKAALPRPLSSVLTESNNH